jgi:hypothetical protein
MNNQTKTEQVMAREAPTWLRCALSFQDLPTQEDDASDREGGETLSVEDHPLGFV